MQPMRCRGNVHQGDGWKEHHGRCTTDVGKDCRRREDRCIWIAGNKATSAESQALGAGRVSRIQTPYKDLQQSDHAAGDQGAGGGKTDQADAAREGRTDDESCGETAGRTDQTFLGSTGHGEDHE